MKESAIITQRDYYDYSGYLPVEAQILEVRPSGRQDAVIILLDKTIFYPEGGGQPGDRGTINGLEILDVKEEEGEILHIVSVGNEKPRAGKAELVLDHIRRRDFTVCHTAQHLLSGILFRVFGIPTMSVHLGEEICFIDIECAELKKDKVIEIEETIMEAIEKNKYVKIHLCPPEDAASFPVRKPPPAVEEVIRILEIEGIDYSSCCGTHLDSTAEIGMVRLLEAEKYKSTVRLYFIAGRRCLYDSRNLRDNAEIVSRALSVPLNETGRGVLDFAAKTGNLEQQIKYLKEELSSIKAQALVKKSGFDKTVCGEKRTFIIESYNAEMNDVLNIGKKAQKLSDAVLILLSATENKFASYCSQKDMDIRRVFPEKMEKYGGKGGGGASFFQGSFGTRENLEDFIREICGEESKC